MKQKTLQIPGNVFVKKLTGEIGYYFENLNL